MNSIDFSIFIHERILKNSYSNIEYSFTKRTDSNIRIFEYSLATLAATHKNVCSPNMVSMRYSWYSTIRCVNTSRGKCRVLVKKQGSNLIDLRLTWREMDYLIFE